MELKPINGQTLSHLPVPNPVGYTKDNNTVSLPLLPHLLLTRPTNKLPLLIWCSKSHHLVHLYLLLPRGSHHMQHPIAHLNLNYPTPPLKYNTLFRLNGPILPLFILIWTNTLLLQSSYGKPLPVFVEFDQFNP